jgi:lipoic acid synthetase
MKPEWLKVRAVADNSVYEALRALKLHTVCEEANCPNIGECFGKKTAAFMILGNVCTRRCAFCAVTKGKAGPLDPEEPENVARCVRSLALKHAVITSVTRDDLPDGGASHFAETVVKIRELCAAPPSIEVLIPDFQGDLPALKAVAAARPEIINHNIETVERLYPGVRPIADYGRSLRLLGRVKELDPQIIVKSGFMVGLGETHEEISALLKDLKESGCDIVTIGQYLAPSKNHHPVVRYVTPGEFDAYKAEGEGMGFAYVASGPLVRSSYMAGEAFRDILQIDLLSDTFHMEES